MKRTLLTIDVGGTFTKYAIVTGTRRFKILKRDKFPTVKTNHEEFLESLADVFDANNDAEGIALSMPGLIDTDKGICISSGALKFSNGHNIAEELQAKCGVRVTVENDANCAALAEAKSGSLVDVKDAFVLVFGTGVGGAFIRNKDIYRGAHFSAGEVSFLIKNICGVANEENFCGFELGALAFQKKCAKVLGKAEDDVTGEMIFNMIEQNDAVLSNALREYAHGVAVMIFNLQVLFDPERFALGGGISERKSFLDAVKDKLDEICAEAPDYLPRPQIVACRYHNDANLLGALYRFQETRRRNV